MDWTLLPSRRKACLRCRQKKVRCSGDQPCSNCCIHGQLEFPCTYPAPDEKVLVDKRFIEDLMAENNRLNRANLEQGSTSQAVGRFPAGSEQDSCAGDLFSSPEAWLHHTPSTQSPIYLPEAACSAFATRIRQAIPTSQSAPHFERVHYVDDCIILSLAETDYEWPSPARAALLVRTALGTIGRRYYVGHPILVLKELEEYSRSPENCGSTGECKFLVLFALGELYSPGAFSKNRYGFPGLLYFSHALKGFHRGNERASISHIETLLLLALYSMSVNRRNSAFKLAMSAYSESATLGLYRRTSAADFPNIVMREHRVRIWWTVCNMGRIFAAKLGHPVFIHDDDIDTELPSHVSYEDIKFESPDYQIAMISLARINGETMRQVYRKHLKVEDLVRSIQAIVGDLEIWVKQLPPHLQLDFKQFVPAHIIYLHLLYNQCVILSTRPMLLFTYRVQLGIIPSQQQLIEDAKHLAKTCVRYAQRSCRILSECWAEGSLWPPDYSSVHNIFSSATALAFAEEVGLYEQPGNNATEAEGLDGAMQLVSNLANNGNLIAMDLLQHLESLKSQLDQSRVAGLIDGIHEEISPLEDGQFAFLSQLDLGVPS